MKNLTSMNTFVLENIGCSSEVFKQKCRFYALFLLQKIEVWMFVPCKQVNGIWVILEEPDHLKFKIKNKFNELVWKCEGASNQYHQLYDEYLQAKENCLFDGFKFQEKRDGFIHLSFLHNENQCLLIFDEESDSILVSTPVFDEYVVIIEELIKFSLELSLGVQSNLKILNKQ